MENVNDLHHAQDGNDPGGCSQAPEAALKSAQLVCVRFLTLPASYIFDAGDLDLKPGEMVLVDTESGFAAGKVLGYPTQEEISGLETIKPVVQRLTAEDREKLVEVQARQQEAFRFCRERIAARNLPMKLTRVEQMFDGSKTTFYFVAEGRVDFRELLKDLVERYRTRIELRQIGSRQESAMLGGIGSCGREVCCSVYLTSFQRISVKMAKNQNMTLNPSKISGLCGKLKCCLAYEKESYANLIENLPKPGKKVFLEQGEATVVSINIIDQTFVAKLSDRRFIKSTVSDILTEEEYRQLSEQKAAENAKMREQSRQEEPRDASPAASKPKSRRRRSSRNRNSKKKRSKPE
ncbi:MAG: regulatory iron-sulfur-containing complex subunit RicT [Desulfomonilia bacterium]